VAQAEWKQTTDLIAAAIGILEEQNPMTVRQLFYQLVSIAFIENSAPDYKRVSRAMTIARQDERVPYDWKTWPAPKKRKIKNLELQGGRD
jgi:hypothetical protein